MSEAVVFIPLTRGKVAVIDFDDFEKVRGFKWHADQDGHTFYAKRAAPRPSKSKLMMHREILGCPAGLEVNHVDGDGLNNQRSNLEITTRGGNSRAFRRRLAPAASKFRGVVGHTKSKRWRACIKFQGKREYLGWFDSEESAARAYDSRAKELGYSKEALNFQKEKI